ncbi:DUF6683 family protein [Rhizobium oryzicola]|uniref:Secreted protein n=1 Tax=Rhizobium oryzicola TaxID=1232668 RepID=A0ABT8SUQ6_9HYPH|nr:DUF6683 family protein [Rhizobium oryzicola]MDO1581467.1 hypothetical protein [Rhizobium oryzicola]
MLIGSSLYVPPLGASSGTLHLDNRSLRHRSRNVDLLPDDADQGMSMSLRKTVSFFVMLLSAGVAHAQYQMISPMLYEGPHISLQDHANRFPSKPSASDTVSLDYRPDPARRRQNIAHFVAQTRMSSPADADNLAQMFSARDILEDMRAPLGKAGLRIDNVADAYAMWWIDAWQASRGINEDVDRQKVIAVRDQAAHAFAQSGSLRGASDAAKQEMAEALLIQALLIETAMEQAKDNPAVLPQLAKAVALGAKGMNVDLSRMTLTANGFVPAK